MLKFLLVLLALYIVNADLALNIGDTYISKNEAQCFKTSTNVTKFIFELLNKDGTYQQKDALQSFINLRNANITDIDAIVSVRDTYDPYMFCSNISLNLPLGFNGTVWLNVSSYSFPTKTEGQITYLDNIAKNCTSQGLDVGIFSKSSHWGSVLGYPSAGSSTLRALPLWYFNDNESADFNDMRYATFGNWSRASMKEFSLNPRFCSYTWRGLDFY